MTTITNYWRIVSPASRKSLYAAPTVLANDSGNINTAGGYTSMATMSWYTSALKGSTGRTQKYKQYDAMDVGDVSRALDILAEEMSNADKRTKLPFIIEYQTEENQEIPETTSTTIRAALRHWSNLHNLDKRVFNVSRTLIKYGDCFFRKTTDTKKWEYIDPTRVAGIELDADGNKLFYHIKASDFQVDLKRNTQDQKNITLEICPASSVIHFTTSDDMGPSAPFGISCLQSVFKDFQKLTMLEDSAIIYRIVRAPERRVFYVDVGNMPAQRVKQQLEQMKNDIRQRRTPNQGNSNQTDSGYNPESISEDYFIPITGGGTGARGGRIETLPGGQTWEIPELDYFQNKVFRGLRVPSSYMKGQDAAAPGATYNDGKTGVAYMEERIFANYVARLQSCVDNVFDKEFKIYLQVTGVKVDTDLFKLVLCEPQNFTKWIQSALDTDLISTFKSIEDVGYLSKRFMMERFLGLTKDDIQMNESMLKQERGIKEALNVDDIRQVYDPIMMDARKAPDLEMADETEPNASGGDSEPAEAPEKLEKPTE